MLPAGVGGGGGGASLGVVGSVRSGQRARQESVHAGLGGHSENFIFVAFELCVGEDS